MKKIKLSLTLLASLLSTHLVMSQNVTTPPATTSAATAACTLPGPQAYVQDAVKKVLAVLTANQSNLSNNFPAVVKQLHPILEPLIAINTISQFVVPPSLWSASSSQDQASFNDALITFFVILYAGALQNYTPDTYDVQVYPLRGSINNTVQINTAIINKTNSSGTVLVSFILKQTADGCNWQFGDLSVNNSLSLIQSVQQQIQSLIQNMQTPTLAQLTTTLVNHNNNSLANTGS